MPVHKRVNKGSLVVTEAPRRDTAHEAVSAESDPGASAGLDQLSGLDLIDEKTIVAGVLVRAEAARVHR
jgi:hypothetical protein